MATNLKSTATSADLAQADDAATTVRENGGGDIAVYEAREQELATIRDRAVALANIDREAANAKAELWGGKRGATMRENASRDYSAACKAAGDSYYDALDSFAMANNFLAMVDGDRALEILGRRVEYARAAFAAVFTAAKRAGFDVLPSTTGTVYNVIEMLDTLTAVPPTAAAA